MTHRRLFGGGFEDVEREGCGGGLLGRVLLVRRVVAKASPSASPRFASTAHPAWWDGVSHAVTRPAREHVTQPARSSLNPRDRHLTREIVT